MRAGHVLLALVVALPFPTGIVAGATPASMSDACAATSAVSSVCVLVPMVSGISDLRSSVSQVTWSQGATSAPTTSSVTSSQRMVSSPSWSNPSASRAAESNPAESTVRWSSPAWSPALSMDGAAQVTWSQVSWSDVRQAAMDGRMATPEERQAAAGPTLTVVTPPSAADLEQWKHGKRAIGDVVESLPPVYMTVQANGREYYAWDGVYYARAQDGGRAAYAVVSAPLGLVVSAVPAGAEAVEVGASTYWLLDGVWYQPTTAGFLVVDPPR